MTDRPDPTSLLHFARVNDAAAATTKKLQKQAILAEYFRALSDDDDLRLAVRYAAGRNFAGTDERVLAVGGALVSDAVLSLLTIRPEQFRPIVVSSGEIGEALSKVWGEHFAGIAPDPDALVTRGAPATPTSRLHLSDLARAFDDLASTGNQEQKRAILRELFARCAEPREATYLAKVIFGDLRTGVQEGVLHAAIAEAFGRDGKAVQRAQLLVGDLGEVAVLARHDRLGEAQFALFHPIQFMLATPQETAAGAAETMDGRAFWAEDKLDGIRAQVHKSGDRVAIYTRTMDRTDASFPDVAEALRKLPSEFLLDGEIVPYRGGCVLPFAHIQRRLGRKVLTPEIVRDNPCVFIAFDVLYRDGRLLMDEPLRQRRAQLEDLAGAPTPQHAASDPVIEVDHGTATTGEGATALPAAPDAPLVITKVTLATTAEEIQRAFAAARECRNEGVILKDPDSVYSPGRRGQMWLKIKTHLPTLDCVVTAAEYGHGKRRQLLSDYTFAVWDRDPADDGAALLNIGKAYSGVTDEEIRQLTELFHKLSVKQVGHVHVVKPEVVMEIACDQIQRSDRHASGFALRFPRIKRIRWDKRPADADRLQRVTEIYDSSANTARVQDAGPSTDGGSATPAARPTRGRGRRRKASDAAQPSLFDLS